MVRRIVSGCAAAWLGLQLIFGMPPLAMAQPTPDLSPEPTSEQVQPESPPQASPQSDTQRPRKNQRLTYPEPPDEYDYESLRQYDEEIYGEQEMLKERGE
ncbi:MAG: hypothetical protein AAGF01_32705 [Cyanobacteria bacterium P01_G01_bin.38]